MNVQVSLILKECENKIRKHEGYRAAKLFLLSAPKGENLSIDHIAEVVCGVTGVPFERAKRKDRTRSLVTTRQLICLYARGYTSHSYKEISFYVGLTDHTSSIHSIRKVIELIQVNDPLITEACKKINNLLNIQDDRPPTTRTPDGDCQAVPGSAAGVLQVPKESYAGPDEAPVG